MFSTCNHVSVNLEGRIDCKIIALILPSSQENGSITLLDKHLTDTWQNYINVEQQSSSLNSTVTGWPKQAILH